MFNGPSTVRVNWGGRGLVLDLSAVHHDPSALTLVMVAATGWLQAAMAVPDGIETPRRVQVVDEAYALLREARVALHFQSSIKLRGAGERSGPARRDHRSRESWGARVRNLEPNHFQP